MKLAWVVCAAVSLIAGNALAGLKLAENGQVKCVIVLPADAIAAEQTAAKELQKYLKAITGAEPAIVADGAGSKLLRIHVGQSNAVQKLVPEVNFKELLTDSIVIKSVGDQVVLAGSRPRGSLYAVFDFLENQCGVRFWTSDETDVPRNSNLEVGELNRVYTPKIRYREVFNADAMYKHGPFAVALKLNGHHNYIPEEWGGHYTLIGWCHTAFTYIPPSKWFKTHPEWFAMLKGKRSTDGQLCLSNEEMRKEMTRVVLNRVRKNPDAGMISVSQNDGYGPCECEKCQAIVKEEGSEAGPVIRFVNAVAGEVKKEYPDFLVETLAYVYSRKPPKLVKPADNVLVRLCSIECDFAHPLSGSTNAAFAKDLAGWSAISKNMFIWNYVTNFSNYLIPQPNIRPIADDLRLFEKSHVVGVFQQGDAFNGKAGDMLPLRTWLHAHLLWDPSQDQRKLTETFLRGYYGAAGDALVEYVDVVNSLADKPDFKHGCYGESAAYISDEMLARCDALFAKAAKSTEGDAKLSARVARERLAMDYLHVIRYPFKENLKEKGAEAMKADYQKQVQTYAQAAKNAGVRTNNEGGSFDQYVKALMGRAEKFVEKKAAKGKT